MMLRRRLPGSEGFTLVELMVALSGGLFLSMMVFALSRDTSRFYQRENRLAGAVLAGMNGFERLKGDIARAGYLTTPNIIKDPKMCMRPLLGWPTQLARMSSLRIDPDVPDLTGNGTLTSVTPALKPDQLILAGSYTASDEFPVAQFVPGSTTVFLEKNMGALARLGYNKTTVTADQTAILQSIFKKDRVLRITDKAGLAYFGVIDGAVGGDTPSVVLKTNPGLQSAGMTTGCGMTGFSTGSSANVVNFVRYQIRDLRAENKTRFKPLFDQSAGAPGEATRTELVRSELKADGTEIEAGTDLTIDLVAEYAVDLAFSATAVLPPTWDNLADVQPGTSNFTAIFNTNPDLIGEPQRVRAVRVRLSVRSREADRAAAISLPGLYRVKLPDGDWARVRTFQADVALQNQIDTRG